MGLFKIMNKNKVPDELPELATDKIEENLNKTNSDLSNKKNLKNEPKPIKKLPSPVKLKIPDFDLPEDEDSEEGFFNELADNLEQGMNKADKFENWYNKKLHSHDIVNDMRKYWEKQKPETILKTLGKDFKLRVAANISQLKQLEKEWQDNYFDLIEKEEEIREKEKELKKVLEEFIELCKRRTKKKSKS